MVPLAAMLGGYRMGFTKSLVTAWLASQAIVAAANAAEPVRSHGTPAALSDQRYSHQKAIGDSRAAFNPDFSYRFLIGSGRAGSARNGGERAGAQPVRVVADAMRARGPG